MKARQIKPGQEYSYQLHSWHPPRRVLVVQEAPLHHAYNGGVSKGWRVQFLAEPPNGWRNVPGKGESSVVGSREIVRPWAEQAAMNEAQAKVDQATADRLAKENARQRVALDALRQAYVARGLDDRKLGRSMSFSPVELLDLLENFRSIKESR